MSDFYKLAEEVFATDTVIEECEKLPFENDRPPLVNFATYDGAPGSDVAFPISNVKISYDRRLVACGGTIVRSIHINWLDATSSWIPGLTQKSLESLLALRLRDSEPPQIITARIISPACITLAHKTLHPMGWHSFMELDGTTLCLDNVMSGNLRDEQEQLIEGFDRARSSDATSTFRDSSVCVRFSSFSPALEDQSQPS